MDRQKKNLQRKIQIKYDQRSADLELRKEELENLNKLKALSEKLDEDVSRYDQKIEKTESRIKRIEEEMKIIGKELK